MLRFIGLWDAQTMTVKAILPRLKLNDDKAPWDGRWINNFRDDIRERELVCKRVLYPPKHAATCQFTAEPRPLNVIRISSGEQKVDAASILAPDFLCYVFHPLMMIPFSLFRLCCCCAQKEERRLRLGSNGGDPLCTPSSGSRHPMEHEKLCTDFKQMLLLLTLGAYRVFDFIRLWNVTIAESPLLHDWRNSRDDAWVITKSFLVTVNLKFLFFCFPFS